MAAKKPVCNKLIRELLTQFPNQSKGSIARIAYEKYPLQFESVESARSSVRAITGAFGSTSAKGKNLIHHAPSLPESNCKKREFYRLPASSNHILWLSDIHIPNQDNEALEAAIAHGKRHRVNCIVLGGDILDNTPFSSHDGPPPGSDDVREWFYRAEELFKYLRYKFPQAHIIWIEGNHDAWMKRFLMKKAPILFNDEYYHLPQRLNLKKYNIEYYGEHVIVMAGKLQLAHGHTLIKGFFAPVNAARGLFLRTKSNSIIGHVHTTSEHSEGTLKGESIATFSTGCLCTLSPDYDPHNTKHNQGFARITIDEKGWFKVNNYRIEKGQII